MLDIKKAFLPATYLNISNKILISLAVLTLALFSVGIYLVFQHTSADYQQGEYVRIMYIHVPAAWMSMFIYVIIAICSLCYLIWRSPVAAIIARDSGLIGACFTLITLITGSLWGKPIWGTWWVWDARLTSVFILFLIYIGYILMANAKGNFNQTHTAAAILALIGLINIPIIKFSVDIWNSLHQPASIIKFSKPSIHISMLKPLILMFFASLLYYITVVLYRVKASLIENKIIRYYTKSSKNSRSE